ncbi:hypothetical protein ACGFNU_33245 [Spirillospora sp. NPDC048911]|uniref:hypothetical protein n=1 Tax=Spirillospora sp. NPDC048911 TaxID=3364527 RepID=UPI00371A5F8F
MQPPTSPSSRLTRFLSMAERGLRPLDRRSHIARLASALSVADRIKHVLREVGP